MTTKTKNLLPVVIVIGFVTICLLSFTLWQKYTMNNLTDSKYGTYNLDAVILPNEWSTTKNIMHEDTYTLIEGTSNSLETNDSTSNNSDYSNDTTSNNSDYSNDSYASGTYILSGSDSRYISREEALNLSPYNQRIARNEIYARHGRMFNDTELQAYFNSQSWYTPVYSAEQFDSYGNSLFNDYEITNLTLLSNL